MKFGDTTMLNRNQDLKDYVERSVRNDDALLLEEIIRSTAPLPISYDVTATQSPRFSELSYTEFMGGIYLTTQSVEINTKLLYLLSLEDTEIIDGLEDKLKSYIVDKYNLTDSNFHTVSDIGFMTGHNFFDLVSAEIIARLAFENPNFMVKLHPITNNEYASKLAQKVGWDKIIKKDLSGVDLLKNCTTAYVHTATELCAMAVLLDKKIVNISNFFHEARGTYYAINTLLFKSDNPKQLLLKLISNPYSGIIFTFMDDAEIRIKNYFDYIIKIKNIYQDISSIAIK